MNWPVWLALALAALTLAAYFWLAWRYNRRARRLRDQLLDEYPWEPMAREFAAKQRRLAIERRKQKESGDG